MKGCSTKNRKYRGGNSSRIDLAYPYTGIQFQKPPLAYMKGGNDKSAAYPNEGPPMRPTGVNWLNSNALQSGGRRRHTQKGGNGLPYGQGLPEMQGIRYPNGLTGASWGANLDWPATSNIVANNNHYALNTYSPNDVPLQMVDVGANRPFLGFKGGRRKKRNITKKRRQSKKRKSRMSGGTSSNLLSQDLLNGTRQFETGLVNMYKTLKGDDASVSPLPWKDQFPNRN